MPFSSRPCVSGRSWSTFGAHLEQSSISSKKFSPCVVKSLCSKLIPRKRGWLEDLIQNCTTALNQNINVGVTSSVLCKGNMVKKVCLSYPDKTKIKKPDFLQAMMQDSFENQQSILLTQMRDSQIQSNFEPKSGFPAKSYDWEELRKEKVIFAINLKCGFILKSWDFYKYKVFICIRICLLYFFC